MCVCVHGTKWNGFLVLLRIIIVVSAAAAVDAIIVTQR